jgi:hypothetical protein
MGMAFCATATTEKIAALAAKTSSRGIIQMRKFFVDVSFKAIESHQTGQKPMATAHH